MSQTSDSSAGLAEQLTEATRLFQERFGRRPTVAAAAPGRVNLIGEHVDYNEGFVLPMAIERQTLIVADRASGPKARIVSTQQEGVAEFEVPSGGGVARGTPEWSNYVRGVVEGFLQLGWDVPGFDAVVSSTVPVGGGLSSSAAIEVATATLMEELCGKKIDTVAKALLCQKAEHEYAKVPCGIMDQFISVMGQAGHALLLDCRTHDTVQVRLDDPAVAVLIINTNVRHELSGGEYAQRRRQCEEAAKVLGVRSLRDASMEQLMSSKSRLDPVVLRRAHHIIGEIARTTDAAAKLENGDWLAMGKLMHASHVSLRDAYEVSCKELDVLVDLAMEIGPPAPGSKGGGVYGSRMTGGGFGGCTVSLVESAKAAAIQAEVCLRYHEQTGIEPSAFVTRPGAGARAVKI
ncbi:MAG: galactokinase [Phycisphaeraceae bacterium]|nr:galactokinase [Phycisphaeraceae bacterium]